MTATQGARTPPAATRWLSLAIIAVIPLLLLRAALRPVDDPDAFWHVLSGQHAWSTRDVVGPDPFGHFSTNTWIQLDWLSDLWMAGAYDLGGLPAVAWVYAVLTIGVFLAAYLACRPRAEPLVAAIAAVTAWIGASASLAFRPQTVSFILLAVSLWAWYRTRGDERARWWLIPVGWLWACSHGLWFLGPVVGGITVVGMLLDGSRDTRVLARLSAIPLGTVLLALATPVGPQILSLPFTVNSYASIVSEYRPPDVHEPAVAVTFLLIAIAALGWARSGSRVPWADLLLWLAALPLGLLYTRTVAVAAILAAPLAASQLQGLLSRAPDPRWSRAERAVLGASAVVTFLLAALLAPRVADGPGGMPTGLDARLDAMPPGSVVLNDDHVGGWLLLTHPELRPVADTRTYLFSFDYLARYKDARAARGDWAGFVDTTRARYALLRDGEPLTAALQETGDWARLGSDGSWVLLERR